MKKFNKTIFRFIFSLLLLFAAIRANAQSPIWDTVTNSYGTFILGPTYNGHVSDYYFTLTMKNVVTGDACPQDMNFYVGSTFLDGNQPDQYCNYDHTSAEGFPFDTVLLLETPGSSFASLIGPDTAVNVYVSYIIRGYQTCGGAYSSITDSIHANLANYTLPMTAHTSYLIGPQLNITQVPRAGNSSILQPLLTWTKKSDVPDSLLFYVVIRADANGQNQIALDTIQGDTLLYGGAMTYEDNALLQHGSYLYYIEVYLNDTLQHLREQSGSNSVTATMANSIMAASQGTDYGYTQLTWLSLATSAPNNIAIQRNGQQIAVIDKGSTSYSDYNGIPGVNYNYTVAPLDANFNSPLTYSDSGYSKPNGVIKGNVYTIYNAGVQGVTVYAYANVNTLTIMDSAVTDASGYYELDNLFYDTSAVFTIKPVKSGHKFNPDSLSRTLTINTATASGVNFTDTTVFTIAGTVAFAYNVHCAGGSCPSAGVTIYSNGQPTQGVSNSLGQFSFAIQTEGTYVLTPVLAGHTFWPDTMVLTVTGSNLNLSFIDSTTDTLYISLTGGCHNQVADSATVSINSTTNTAYAYNGFELLRNGNLSNYIVLPAQKYSVNSLVAYSGGSLDGNINTTLGTPNFLPADLTSTDSAVSTQINMVFDTTVYGHSDTIQRSQAGFGYIYMTLDTFPFDTIYYRGLIVATPTSIDTVMDTVTTNAAVRHQAAFVYGGRLTAAIVNFPLNACTSINGGFILSQYSTVDIPVQITETYSYSNTTCPVDSGQIDIYDDVSDIAGVQTVNFYNGQYYYPIHPASINVDSPYTKLLEFFVTADNATTNTSQEIIVTGAKNFTQAFISTTPGLPFFILHAPPGNNSASYLSTDNAITTTNSFSVQVGGSQSPYVKIGLGAEEPVPFTGLVLGEGTELTNTVTAGANATIATELQSTFTAHTQVTTASGGSGNNNYYTGHMGDVYVGASMNVTFAYGEVLQIPTGTCALQLSNQLIINNVGLATNYFYTEDHIVNTLIPQLQGIQASLLNRYIDSIPGIPADTTARDSAALYGTYVAAWQNQVQMNHRNTDTISIPGQNISFADGANYDNSTTTSNSATSSMQFSMFVNTETDLSLVFGVVSTGDLDNTSIGTKINLTWNTDLSTSTNTNTTRTIGYHLEDDNTPGNYYSMNVNTDPVYGTPCFVNVEGASACPHWPGTQARDSVDITMDNYAISNVPLTQTANFIVNIMNESESGETRTYDIEAVPESNPNGAIISIGGQQINNSPASFTVAPGTALPVLLTVAAGPVAADYANLQVSAFSPCDGGEGNTITFTADFQSACSPISIYTPANNWLVNGASHDTLMVILSGYNYNDTSMKYIGLQYRQPGGPWYQATNPPIPADSLFQQFYTVAFDVSSLSDGPYEIQAFAYCASQLGGESYSPILAGTIDRSSLSLFGTPTPSDGILNVNDQISVSFNGSINCAEAAAYIPIYSSLVTASGDTIPDSVTCSGSELIIYTNPPGLINNYNNQTLTCTISNVYDIYGNVLQQPIVWSFLVNTAKFYWNPADLNISSNTGASAAGAATMANTGPAVTFTLSHLAPWLTPTQGLTYAISAGTPTAPSTLTVPFTVSNSLNPGSYSDTVIATANGEQVYLYVNVNIVTQSPNWYVDSALYQYSMNITTNYSTTSLNAPLSADTRDIIAAFVGNQCRGVGYITYNAASNSYNSYITAYSNSSLGDTFTFRMWDALPGIEYEAAERLPFITDGIIGQPLAPYILHADGVFQSIPLSAGWTWFSLNVTNADMSLNNVLSSITGNSGAVVKTQNSYAQYTTAATGWQGTLAAFSTNNSYMINLDHADTLHFLGQLVSDTTSISVASGWNWIGFPRVAVSSDSAYLRNLNADTNDLFKSQSLYALYTANGWVGSLNYLYPGEGYKLKSANAFNFVVPPLKDLPNWNVNENQFEQNESVTTDLQFDGASTTQSHYLVGAFANGICVGIAQPQFLAALNLYRVFMTIQGDTANAGQALTFKVYDTDNDIEYTPTYLPLSVKPDTSVGTIPAAYVVNVETATGINALTYTEGYSLLQNIPNPFSQTTSIQYTLPSAQGVTITLYDESGRLIRELVNSTQAAGNHAVSFEQDNLQSGVYFYEMKAGDFVKTRKMMILQ
jgi:hypothetical protein